MSDFEPTTDLPDRIDTDDTPVASTAKSRDAAVQSRRKRLILGVAVVGYAVLVLGLDQDPIRTLIAVAAAFVLLTFGLQVIGSFARPIPEAPPAGELRRVRLKYRCPSCGTELRMTHANDQVPDPPRHCADEMELLTNLDDVM